MGRSFNKTLILGKGSIGFYLYNFLIAKGFYSTRLIPLRSEGKKISNIIELINDSDLIIDCMDRNIGEVDGERTELVRKIRNNIYEKKNIMYLYLSSTNIYSISSNRIGEDGEISSEKLSIYQKNKINVENQIQKRMHPHNFLIARMPSIWGIEIYNKSFMFDLLNDLLDDVLSHLQNHSSNYSYMSQSRTKHVVSLLVISKVFWPKITNLNRNIFSLWIRYPYLLYKSWSWISNLSSRFRFFVSFPLSLWHSLRYLYYHIFASHNI